MNRGGLTGASWEIDDRFTAYDAPAIAAMGFEGGKMLTRIDLGDPATASMLENCAAAVSALADRRLIAMVEPFMAATDRRSREDRPHHGGRDPRVRHLRRAGYPPRRTRG